MSWSDLLTFQKVDDDWGATMYPAPHVDPNWSNLKRGRLNHQNSSDTAFDMDLVYDENIGEGFTGWCGSQTYQDMHDTPQALLEDNDATFDDLVNIFQQDYNTNDLQVVPATPEMPVSASQEQFHQPSTCTDNTMVVSQQPQMSPILSKENCPSYQNNSWCSGPDLNPSMSLIHQLNHRQNIRHPDKGAYRLCDVLTVADDGYGTDDCMNTPHSSSSSTCSESPLLHSTIKPLPKSHSSFWQYNSQLKGPRGQKFLLNMTQSMSDPHKVVQFKDPVFDKTQHVHINHVGKARKGDGTDITPNPQKLSEIGKELTKLHEQMAELGKRSEPWARREKNRLASKVCRLKKKANNEANKVKLSLLRKEQGELNAVIRNARKLLHAASKSGYKGSLSAQLKSIVSSGLKTRVAGHTTESVDHIIENTKAQKF